MTKKCDKCNNCSPVNDNINVESVAMELLKQYARRLHIWRTTSAILLALWLSTILCIIYTSL